MSETVNPLSSGSRFRYRMAFAKTDAMRFVGHLDLHRTLERTLRRAQLPLVYSQGFSPHPRITLAAALPLGCTGEAELADFWLEQEKPTRVIHESLQRAQPPGLRIEDVQCVSETEPSLPAQVTCSEYEVRLEADVGPQVLRQRVDEMLARDELPRTRRGKDYDLRPLLLAIEVRQTSAGGSVLWMQLAAKEGATGRPDEVLEAMGLPLGGARIIRRRLLLGGQAP